MSVEQIIVCVCVAHAAAAIVSTALLWRLKVGNSARALLVILILVTTYASSSYAVQKLEAPMGESIRPYRQ
jgi:hypothetical protein